MQKNALTGKVALVTGSARRIGAEIAQVLHEAGMNIVLHYNASEGEAIQLCEQLNDKRKQSAAAIHAELLDSEIGKTLIQQATEVWQRLDLLVNNASRFYRTPWGETTEYAWDELMNINLKAPFFLSQAAAPFLAAHQGSIVNITDIHAKRPIRDYGVYCISKSGLTMMTKVLAKELGPLIRVNAVAPGAILWPEGQNTLGERDKQHIIDDTILQQPGHPNDIAKAVLYLTRDANYMTGQVLVIDGGRTLDG